MASCNFIYMLLINVKHFNKQLKCGAGCERGCDRGRAQIAGEQLKFMNVIKILLSFINFRCCILLLYFVVAAAAVFVAFAHFASCFMLGGA